ncbi:MAG TPA: MBL fold metallo-hydrolase [Methanofollis liminatans]|uniref:MBL fold metallo-hydrolase n=1 Tax=Methanofollis liminatans TaxID=2201 RepID=A0A831PLD0_9EURY|nr:MBL fold metallo-hydrolase [Methanofollis liminatans]
MDLTVLCDNTTLIDRYFLGEPGISFHIRDGETTVLFDLGYSDIFLQNAMAMGIDLLRTNIVAFSHAHLDHTWGLMPLLGHRARAVIEGQEQISPTFLAHPAIFRSVTAGGVPEIGMPVDETALARQGEVRLSREPVWITDDLVFLGEIPGRFPFEDQNTVGECGGAPDTVPDDTALAYCSEDGLVVITGCAHAGICSTIARAKEVCGESRIACVIGGFHLLTAAKEQIDATCRYFAGLDAGAVHPCHCTGLPATIALAGVANVRETGVGLRLSFSGRS